MHWHAQPVVLKLRGFIAPGGYERRAPFAATVDITILAGGLAFASGAMSVGGVKIGRDDYARIAELLKPYGVTKLMAERGGKLVAWDSPDEGSRPMELDLPPIEVVPAAVDIELP